MYDGDCDLNVHILHYSSFKKRYLFTSATKTTFFFEFVAENYLQ